MKLTVFAALILLGASLPLVLVAAETKKATPPKPEEIVGTWVGFWEDEEFTRLDLRTHFNGYCAYVAPPEFVTHRYGVHVYRITRWSLQGWNLSIDLTPVDPHDEKIYLKGRTDGIRLQLEIGGANRKWKEHVVLFKESVLQGADLETEAQIKRIETQQKAVGP